MAKHYLLAAAIIVALFWGGVYLWSNSLTTSKGTSGAMPANVENSIGNATASGFHITPQMAAANSSSQCSLQQVTFCDNNEPSQFVCVNQAYASNVNAQYKLIYAGRGQACPEFVLAGHISCTISAGYCAVTDNKTT